MNMRERLTRAVAADGYVDAEEAYLDGISRAYCEASVDAMLAALTVDDCAALLAEKSGGLAACSASRMPEGMGVIWSQRYDQAVVYQLHPDGRVESARLLAGAFLELDEHLKLAIAYDLVKARDKA